MFPAVVFIDDSCSGTLISPNHVLTAAHCVDTEPLREVVFRTGGSFSASRRVTGCWIAAGYLAAAGVEPDAECGTLPPRATIGGNRLAWDVNEDIAVLSLESPVAPTRASGVALRVDPLSLLPSADAAPSFPTDATVVGFGINVYDRQNIFLDGLPGLGVRRWATTSLSLSTRGYLYAEDAVASGGDSGGPALWTDGSGTLRILGVNSQLLQFSSGGATNWDNDFGNLIDQSHQDWVRSRVDLDADGRVDLNCAGGVHLQWDASLSVVEDLDGDGVANASDNCPTAWNPCQEDLNGNGVGNACDSCGGSSIDTDGDGFLDGCDNCPDVVNTDQLDSDRDGTGNECDECPSHWNPPGSPDSDGDGVPDVCDSCPTVAEAVDDTEATDPLDSFERFGDGTPDACDNCPDDRNTFQENCNIDAERAQGLFDPGAGQFGVGDVCDPTPCGETHVLVARDRIDGELQVDHRLVVDARGFKETNGMPVDATLRFRFCTCDDVQGDSLEERARCADPFGSNCVIAASQYDAAETSWRVMSAAGPGAETGPVAHSRPLPITARAPLSFESDEEALWKSRVDRALWGEPAGPMSGVLWTHSLASDRTLASHFWAGTVDDSISVRAPLPCLRHVGPLFAWSGCPTCEGSFPWGFVVAPELVDACGLEPDWGIRFLDDVFPPNAAPDLAATYDETSGWLVVLEAHAPERMRLRRIDPFSGQTHAVRGSELDRKLAKAWALAAAPDGSVYLVVGNGAQSLILRGSTSPNAIWRGERVVGSPYAGGAAPVATDLGLSFIVKAPGGSALTGVRTSELLPPDSNHWKDIL